MDARALLERVSRAYGEIETLQIEALLIGESEEEGATHRNETRLKFHYAAPGKVRVEQPGRQGSVMVSDGREFHTFFAAHQRYFRNPAPPPEQLPGAFLPEFPMAGQHGPFLFGAIGRRVAEAAIAGEATLTVDGVESVCHVLSVRYEPSPAEVARVNRPVRFWIDVRTSMVLRLEGEFDLRHARDGAVTVNKRAMAVTRLVRNEALPPGIFEFTPPPGAVESSGRGGGGGSETSFVPGGRISRHSSSEWEGATFVDRSTMTIREHTVEVERRWSVSPDGATLDVTETIRGPKGPLERSYAIPLR